MKITCFLNRNPREANILPRFNITYFAKITEKMLVFQQNNKGIFSSQVYK